MLVSRGCAVLTGNRLLKQKERQREMTYLFGKPYGTETADQKTWGILQKQRPHYICFQESVDTLDEVVLMTCQVLLRVGQGYLVHCTPNSSWIRAFFLCPNTCEGLGACSFNAHAKIETAVYLLDSRV